MEMLKEIKCVQLKQRCCCFIHPPMHETELLNTRIKYLGCHTCIGLRVNPENIVYSALCWTTLDMMGSLSHLAQISLYSLVFSTD